MSATAERMRIGEVARRLGTTTRTIRYYEEIGLLGGAAGREAGQHRLYGDEEVERLRDALRLKSLLGLSLEELGEVLEGEEARAARRDEWQHANPDPARRREILEQAQAYAERQLALVRRRREELDALEAELAERRGRIGAALAQLPRRCG
jgi:MerR family transcriptional regulator, repressor of the yfmOP operon